MAETPVNFYGGSPLNRLSWLRTSQAFLNAIVALPSTKWILFNAGQPLASSGSGKPTPIFLAFEDIVSLLGPAPYFGQGQEPGSLVAEKGAEEEHTHAQHSPLEGARHLGLPVVFLGLFEKKADDSSTALPTSEFKDPAEALKKLEGTPYCAVDLMDLEYSPEQLQAFLDGTTPGREGVQLAWAEPRSLMSTLDGQMAAIFANARSMTDWNQRNKFCAGCGTKTYSMWGGWKIACRSLLPWVDNTGKKPCPTVKGLHNFTHPRTDAVVIMIAIDETGEKVLLGRGRKWPGKFYSALAGFIEPGESFEDAVAREMWEEAGVHVWNIKYHSGQPWPFPANLMVGFYARADSTKPIRTDLDNELIDARWYTRDEVLAVLNHKAGTRFGGRDYKKMSEIVDGPSSIEQKKPPTGENAAHILAPADPRTQKEAAPKRRSVEIESQDEPPFRLPPTSAIAGVLIRDWAERRIGFPPEESVQKGNL